MNELIQVVLASLASIVVLFMLSKLMGNREISQLSMFDYINGITIGSIAAEMATQLEDIRKPLVAMIVYGIVTAFIAKITCKSMILRRFITGRPVVLFENGKLYEKNLAKTKLDINEFLTQCRNSGYFDLNNIQTAILETNGRISFLPVVSQRPVTPQDLQLSPPQERPVANVIIDGRLMNKNLKHIGQNKAWLTKQLNDQGVTDISDVFLATCDCDGKLTVYLRIKEKINRDLFE